MKKFKFTINGNPYEVEINSIEDNIAEVTVNGTTYQVEIDRKVEIPKISKIEKNVPPPTLSNTTKTQNQASANDKEILKVLSPLPGTIIELHVKQGDNVKKGQKIITIEAMKMENVLYAEKDGVIQQIAVSKGQSIKEGDLLLVIGG